MIRSLGDALNTQTKRTGRLALREVAAVVAVVAALGAAPSAWSLSLGRLSVQSALGESLRAEIDVSLVDYTGGLASGRLMRGANPVLVTFELVLQAD